MVLCTPLAKIFGIGNLFAISGVLALTIITVFVLSGQIRKIDFDAAECRQSEAAAVDELTEPVPAAAVESI